MSATRLLALCCLVGVISLQVAPGGSLRGAGGQQNIVNFVAPTKLVSIGGDRLALCHLVKQSTVLFVPFASKSSGYVLVPNRCQSDDVFYLSTSALTNAQAEGKIPATVPARPAIQTLQAPTKKMAFTIATLLIGIALLIKLRSAFRQITSRRTFAAGPKLALNTLDAMCHVAKTCADRDGSEVSVIAAASQELTGVGFADDKIENLIATANADLSSREFLRFAKGMNAANRRIIMRGVMMVAAADGPMSDAAQRFINQLSNAFEISEDEAIGIFKNLLNPVANAATSGSLIPAG